MPGGQWAHENNENPETFKVLSLPLTLMAPGLLASVVILSKQRV